MKSTISNINYNNTNQAEITTTPENFNEVVQPALAKVLFDATNALAQGLQAVSEDLITTATTSSKSERNPWETHKITSIKTKLFEFWDTYYVNAEVELDNGVKFRLQYRVDTSIEQALQVGNEISLRFFKLDSKIGQEFLAKIIIAGQPHVIERSTQRARQLCPNGAILP